MSISLLLPWYRHRRTGNNSALDDLSRMQWCITCQDENDVITEKARHEQMMWVYRKRCSRCGSVVQWGVARNALKSTTKSIMDAASRWIHMTGRDRR